MQSLLGNFRVLDLTDEKGLLCGKILGDLGADVVKIERPGGDAARNFGPFYHDIPNPKKSLFWFAFNTSKRGITLDIETNDGQRIFKRLAETADFVVESFPPGYLAQLGLGYSALREINPRIIMTSISPFGQAGPYKDYKACDIVIMAMGGLMYICGDADRAPIRISVEQSYHQAGAQAAVASLIAHYYRELTGQGQWVDVSMQECIVWTTNYSVPYWNFGRQRFARSGNRQTRMQVTYRSIFPCKDGYIYYRVMTGPMMGQGQARLVEAMDEERLAGDLKEVNWAGLSFEKVPQKDIDHWEEAVGTYFMNHTKAELHELAVKRDIMLIPVKSPKGIIEYSQLCARDYWTAIEHPELGTTITYPGAAFVTSKTSCAPQRRAPLIGEHNEEIYERELGLSREELTALKEGNVI